MNFVNSMEEESKAKLKKIILSFYYSEKFTIQRKYCNYRLFKIWTSVDCVKSFLIYDVFEYLADYLIFICDYRDEIICFDHLENFDCLNFEISGLTKIPSYKNIVSLLYVDYLSPFRIVSIYKMPTYYGDACVVILSNDFFKSKHWLPKSAVKQIAKKIKNDDPYNYNFSVNKVYICVSGIKKYNGKKYVTIDCKLAK